MGYGGGFGVYVSPRCGFESQTSKKESGVYYQFLLIQLCVFSAGKMAFHATASL
jgi:hypothetical protein